MPLTPRAGTGMLSYDERTVWAIVESGVETDQQQRDSVGSATQLTLLPRSAAGGSSGARQARPFVKWAGGKRRLLPAIMAAAPPTFTRYMEPFVGGGAVALAVGCLPLLLNDANAELMHAFRTVRDDLGPLLALLDEHRAHHAEAYFYALRSADPTALDPVAQAARFVYLNKTCFNGLYRVNKQGQFNTPFGRYKNPTLYDRENMQRVAQLLEGAELHTGDYRAFLAANARPGDFIYLDPPYIPVSQYSDFKRYTKEQFREDDQRELARIFDELVALGAYPVLSNSYTALTLELYQQHDLRTVEAARNINHDGARRGPIREVIVRPKRRAIFKPAPIIRDAAAQRQMAQFPSSRYMGSKHAILPFLHDVLHDLEFTTALDAFSGSGAVSYLLKTMGKAVVTNDFLTFCYHTANACIVNSQDKLSVGEVNTLLAAHPAPSDFISRTFGGLYFTDDENRFLDNLTAQIREMACARKQSIAFAALSRACLRRRPRGLFTYTGVRYDDGRRDLKVSLEQHFREAVECFNAAVFDNGQPHTALNGDVFALPADLRPDLVYFDPPYVSPHSDNDYTRRYHFVEGLARNWQGLEILEHTTTKKFRRLPSLFDSKRTIHQAFRTLFARFRDATIVVSYSSNGIPTKDELAGLLREYKREVVIHEFDHRYSFGTHNHKVGNNQNLVKEYLFVGK